MTSKPEQKTQRYMKAYQFTFYVDGEQVAFVIAHPSQLDRFQQLITRICRYAVRFGCNVQFDTKEVEQ